MRIIRRDVAYQDRAWHRTVRVTGPALSALAASVELGADGPALLDRALQTRVGFADVRAAYYRSLGSRGSERAGELIRAAADGSSAASERKFVGLLRPPASRVGNLITRGTRQTLERRSTSPSSAPGWQSKLMAGPGITPPAGSNGTEPSRTI